MVVGEYKARVRGILTKAIEDAGLAAEVIDPGSVSGSTENIEGTWDTDFYVRVQLGKLSLQPEFVSQTLKDM